MQTPISPQDMLAALTLVGGMAGDGRSRAHAGCEKGHLPAQWPSAPCGQGWDLLPSCWSRSPESQPGAGSTPLSVCVFSSPHTRIFAPKEGRAEASGAHVLTESHVLPVLRVHGSTQMWPVVVFLPWSRLLSAALWCGASGARAFTQTGFGHTARWSQETQQLCCCQNYGLLPECPWSKLQLQQLPPPLGYTPGLSCLCVSKLSLFPGPDALDPGTCCDIE